ncbi:MAG: phosphoglucosamine mutase [Gammaproteobacteria bacterium]|nr:phosphoglucosamine mutase [Gammaproteobacteria bacterium]
MPKKRQYFGTDGIRGLVGQYPITPDFVLKLGWAVGKALARPGAKVLIGKDTRRSGYMFESALEAGLTAAGMDVYLLGPMPTPGVAYLTRTFMAELGVVISASHNPHHDNGIKFFSRHGAKLDDQTEMAIEQYLDREMEVVAPHLIGKVKRLDDGAGRYIEFCKASLPSFQRLSHLKIVIDCANGATYHIAPDVFRELGAEVIAIHSRPDGLNINLDCGSTHPESLRDAVLGFKADIGVALDGDGDRIVMVDHLGHIIDGDQVLYLLAMMGRDKGLLNGGGVVGTLMSNLGLEIALKKAGIAFARSKVGDRHVMEMLREKNWQLGGESSGHIIWLNSTTTGDGIVAALQVLMIMQETGKKLPELLSDLTLYPQTMINIALPAKWSEAQQAQIDTEVKRIEAELEERGRVLVRPSGTEPLVRVMVEGENVKEVAQFANDLAEFVRNIVKK